MASQLMSLSPSHTHFSLLFLSLFLVKRTALFQYFDQRVYTGAFNDALVCGYHGYVLVVLVTIATDNMLVFVSIATWQGTNGLAKQVYKKIKRFLTKSKGCRDK